MFPRNDEFFLSLRGGTTKQSQKVITNLQKRDFKMSNDISLQTDEELRIHLHGETSKLPWSELGKHFAQGVVIKVEKGIDIIDVAIVIARDDKVRLEKWMNDEKVIAADIDDAKKWHEADASLWSVVVAPFILVQEFVQKLDS